MSQAALLSCPVSKTANTLQELHIMRYQTCQSKHLRPILIQCSLVLLETADDLIDGRKETCENCQLEQNNVATQSINAADGAFAVALPWMPKRSAENEVEESAPQQKAAKQGMSSDTILSQNGDIDEQLHSRQLAVYGRETMRKLAGAHVLISGMRGLGQEIGPLPLCSSHFGCAGNDWLPFFSALLFLGVVS